MSAEVSCSLFHTLPIDSSHALSTTPPVARSTISFRLAAVFGSTIASARWTFSVIFAVSSNVTAGVSPSRRRS
jgi:hypothetical protein